MGEWKRIGWTLRVLGRNRQLLLGALGVFIGVAGVCLFARSEAGRLAIRHTGMGPIAGLGFALLLLNLLRVGGEAFAARQRKPLPTCLPGGRRAEAAAGWLLLLPAAAAVALLLVVWGMDPALASAASAAGTVLAANRLLPLTLPERFGWARSTSLVGLGVVGLAWLLFRPAAGFLRVETLGRWLSDGNPYATAAFAMVAAVGAVKLHLRWTRPSEAVARSPAAPADRRLGPLCWASVGGSPRSARTDGAVAGDRPFPKPLAWRDPVLLVAAGLVGLVPLVWGRRSTGDRDAWMIVVSVGLFYVLLPVLLAQAGVRSRVMLEALPVEQRFPGRRSSDIARQLNAVASEFLGLWPCHALLFAAMWATAVERMMGMGPLEQAAVMTIAMAALTAFMHAGTLLLPRVPPGAVVAIAWSVLVLIELSMVPFGLFGGILSNVLLLVLGLLAAFLADRRARRSPTAGGWMTA